MMCRLIEPQLQPLSGESLQGGSVNTSEGARLDIAMNGFWGGRFERSFIDVRVFNLHAPSYRNQNMDSCYMRHEKEKKRIYERRILEVEHATFTPLVFAVSGGMARECSVFYKRLASMVADKRGESYNETLRWLRCSLSFMLLHSSIQCIRGARSSRQRAIYQPTGFIVNESRINVGG